MPGNLITVADGSEAEALAECERWRNAQVAAGGPSHDWGELILDRWYGWAIRSRLEPMKKIARTIAQHRDGILRWFDSKIANGLIEGINSLVQAAKAKARGYRSLRNLIAITYLIAGKIDLKLAT